MVYLGIDVADRTSSVCAVDGEGQVLGRGELSTDEQSLCEELGRWPEGSRVIVEATPLAEWLARVVEGCGHEVVIIDARAARNLVRSKKKTDARDAYTLARVGASGWYVEVHRKSAPARLRRSELQGRQGLVRAAKALKSQIRGLLRAHGIRVGAVSDGQFAERVRELVAKYEPGLEATLEGLLCAWWEAATQAKRLQREMQRRESGASRELLERLQSVPGVGPMISRAYVATIDDPQRFARAEAVSDYVGLSPSVYQSGETEYRGRITKEGDELLRWHLVEAGHHMLVFGPDCALKRWGERLRQRKGKAKAEVALARKLAVLLWRLWLSGERFDPWRGVPAGA